jgi:glycosyltransferase involved in cell wall biosynthesis
MKLTLVMPAYNEAEALITFLPEVLRYCEQKGHQLIVVNDGSKDETRQVLSKYESNPQLQCIHHKLNRGYGGALKSGFKAVQTPYCVSLDADGQHRLEDIDSLWKAMLSKEADVMVGSRKGQASASTYRGLGKFLLRKLTQYLMPLPIYDLNSGMKMYNTSLVQKYQKICPDSMAFSEVIALIFISKRRLVLEHPIKVNSRNTGQSTINTKTAIETAKEIINIAVLFNPTKIFFTPGILFIGASILWNIRIFLKGSGLSVGSLLGIMTGILMITVGLLAEQLSTIRKDQLDD